MSGDQSHAERVNPPTTFFAGHGVSVEVRPAGEKEQIPSSRYRPELSEGRLGRMDHQ
jgi:hypothetical protein